MSETSKHRVQTVPYCVGNGIDIGSCGDPVVPTAISIDLPDEDAEKYGTSHRGITTIHIRGDGRDLVWFRDEALDYVYSSHLLEDFADWQDVLREWMRVVKPGGNLVLLVPEVTRWAAAVEGGQAPNCNHQHEFARGEIAEWIRAEQPDWEVVEDRYSIPDLTNDVGFPDYSWLVVAHRKALCPPD